MNLQGAIGVPGATGISVGGVAGNSQPIYLSAAPQGGNIQLQGSNQTNATGISVPGGGGAATGSNGAGGYSTGASGAANPNQPYIGQINGQLGQLDSQLGVGLGNLQNSYNNSLNQLQQQYGLAQNTYNTQKQQNTQSYLNNRNNIIVNTNAQQSALQRLLGINGAGNSSAAYDLVPYAASQYGSQNLNQAQQTYGQNGANLNNAWDATQLNYNNGKDNLGQQLYAGQNNLRSGIAQTRANLLSELGQLQNSTQYDPQIEGLLGQITQLSNQYASPVIQTGALGFNPATMANYSLGKQTAAQSSPNPGESDVNPTFLGMLTGQRDQYGNLVTA